jgi:hypothetical protein
VPPSASNDVTWVVEAVAGDCTALLGGLLTGGFAAAPLLGAVDFCAVGVAVMGAASDGAGGAASASAP